MNSSWPTQTQVFLIKRTVKLLFLHVHSSSFLHTEMVDIEYSVFHSTVSKSSDLSEGPPPNLHFTVLRGVNCSGVGVGGSTTVHGYRMCLCKLSAWLPSVHTSHSVCYLYRLPSFHLPQSFCASLPPYPSSSSLNPLYSELFYTFTVSAASRGYPFLQVSHSKEFHVP